MHRFLSLSFKDLYGERQTEAVSRIAGLQEEMENGDKKGQEEKETQEVSGKDGSGGSGSGIAVFKPEKKPVLAPYGIGRRMACIRRYRQQEWPEKNGWN